MSELVAVDDTAIDVADVRMQIERARREGDVGVLQEIQRRARAVSEYVSRQQGELAETRRVVLDLTEAALRAERAIGAWLAENVRHEGGRPNETVDGNDRLPEGVSKDESSKWQRLAALADDEFDAAIVDERAKGKLTRAAILRRAPEPKPRATQASTFNQVNDNIGWARWSWNPVTGCLHNCAYCYARDIANRFFPQGFEPTFLPERLPAPQHTKIPASADPDDPAWRRVFTCSMADLFGKWVAQEWIDAVFEAIVAAPEWEFLCLTKFPQRLADARLARERLGRHHRRQAAPRRPRPTHFAEVKAGVKWLTANRCSSRSSSSRWRCSTGSSSAPAPRARVPRVRAAVRLGRRPLPAGPRRRLPRLPQAQPVRRRRRARHGPHPRVAAVNRPTVPVESQASYAHARARTKHTLFLNA